ncbi:MAG: sulfotransferase [Planctomycetaceae bacterium]
MSPRERMSNFRDPLGLVRRMLASGNRAAYSALFREGISVALKPFDVMFGALENHSLAKDMESDQPLILIVGAPRSGTTLIYQTLSAYLDVTYPSNLTALFPRAPLTAARLQKLIPTKRRPDFRNFYGQTTRMRGPNDAFHLWNRWFGDDRYQLENRLSEEDIADMRRFFAAWTSTFNKPFLNKNNRNTDCIHRLAEYLPNARFVVVRRNPVFVAQSLIQAREVVQGDKSVGWGLRSRSADETQDPLAYVDEVCRQVTAIDTDMDQQLATVDSNRVVEITYETFCEDPKWTIRKIVSAFDGLELAPSMSLEELTAFQISKKNLLTPEEQSRMLQCLNADDTAFAPSTTG